MSTTHILAVPGLTKQTPEFLRALAALADRHGWNASGIASVISHESGFNPSIKNPVGSATGLIQFIESTAKLLGTTTAALAHMTALEQLPYVEKFFAMTLGGKQPSTIEDYILPTYGRSDLVGKPDDYVIDRKDGATPAEQKRYADNYQLDAGKKGYITVGDLRSSMRTIVHRAGGMMVTVPLAEAGTTPVPAPPPSSPSPWVLTPSDVYHVGLDARAVLFVLRKGVNGPLVALYQQCLEPLSDHDVPVTGVFDDATDAATRAWQKDEGLKDDGVVGPKTWTRLLSTVRP